MNQFNPLDLANVPAEVPRLTRIISPAQDGLLDCTSHSDALDLVDALTWMQRTVANSMNGGSTADSAAKLAIVENLIAWLGDVVLEKKGLVLYDNILMRFENLPTQ